MQQKKKKGVARRQLHVHRCVDICCRKNAISDFTHYLPENKTISCQKNIGENLSYFSDRHRMLKQALRTCHPQTQGACCHHRQNGARSLRLRTNPSHHFLVRHTNGKVEQEFQIPIPALITRFIICLSLSSIYQVAFFSELFKCIIQLHIETFADVSVLEFTDFGESFGVIDVMPLSIVPQSGMTSMPIHRAVVKFQTLVQGEITRIMHDIKAA